MISILDMISLEQQLASYREAYRALIALESNVNVDITTLSKRLHFKHLQLLQCLENTLNSKTNNHYEVSKEDKLTIIASLLGGAELVWNPNKLEWRLQWDDSEYSYIEEAWDDLDHPKLVLSSPLKWVVYFQWDEDKDCFQGPEPTPDIYREPDKEAIIRSFGLCPEYEIESTWHSRTVYLIAK